LTTAAALTSGRRLLAGADRDAELGDGAAVDSAGCLQPLLLLERDHCLSSARTEDSIGLKAIAPFDQHKLYTANFVRSEIDRDGCATAPRRTRGIYWDDRYDTATVVDDDDFVLHHKVEMVSEPWIVLHDHWRNRNDPHMGWHCRPHRDPEVDIGDPRKVRSGKDGLPDPGPLFHVELDTAFCRGRCSVISAFSAIRRRCIPIWLSAWFLLGPFGLLLIALTLARGLRTLIAVPILLRLTLVAVPVGLRLCLLALPLLLLITLASRLSLVAIGTGLGLCLLAFPLLALILIPLTGRLLALIGDRLGLRLFTLALFGPIIGSFRLLLGTLCSLFLECAIGLAAARHLLSGRNHKCCKNSCSGCADEKRTFHRTSPPFGVSAVLITAFG
jgi:hypothetical protein